MDATLEPVQFEFGFACDIGPKRRDEPNQDAVAVSLPTDSEPWYPPLLPTAWAGMKAARSPVGRW